MSTFKSPPIENNSDSTSILINHLHEWSKSFVNGKIDEATGGAPEIDQLLEHSGSYFSEGDFPVFLKLLMSGQTLSDVMGVSKEQLEAITFLAHKNYNNFLYDRAIHLFSFLMIYDHSNIDNFLGYAHSSYMLKKYEQAYKNYMYALFLGKESSKLLFFLSECCLKLGKKEEAISNLNNCIMLCCPSNADDVKFSEIAKYRLSMILGDKNK